ncbi:MAG: DNRLRE domain-containing protein, partial [Chitinophagaceae bacterium]|nr:DNRLRE domain-containing protein [Rubrivivax sp.]
MKTFKATALFLLLAGAAGAGTAASLNFQQGVAGYSGQFDTNLRGEEPTTVYGAADEISIDASDGGFQSQGLLRFDNVFGPGASQINPGDTIVSATLTLNITSAGSGFQFHEMLQAWNAASITFASAVDGIQANGVEARALPVVSLGANNGGSNIEGGLLVINFTSALQRAQAGNAPFGWALLPWLPDGTNGVDFYSAEWVTLAERPLLSVQTLPVPEPAAWALALSGLLAITAVARRRR